MNLNFRRKCALSVSVLLICSATLIAQAKPAIPPPQYAFARSLGGAILVAFTPSEAGLTVHYTLDGSTPTESSPVFNTPMLVYSGLTLKAISVDERVPGPNRPTSAVSTHIPVINVPDGGLVWSEEFNNDSPDLHAPSPSFWSFDTGNSGFGNHELETYCALGDKTAPCDPDYANAYVGTDEALHIIARTPAYNVYTSARLNTKGLFSFQYGRVEVRAKVPEGQGLWPAVWLLGTNIDTVKWPACGEMDVLERIGAAKSPDWNRSSIHGPGFVDKQGLGTDFNFPKGTTAADWHKYGMIWKPGSIAFYVDDPKHPYVTYTPDSLKSLSGASWPFDNGQTFFLVVNMAVGGDWPGPPDASTTFPQEMLVDYIRVFKNSEAAKPK